MSLEFLFLFLADSWRVLCELAPWFLLGAVIAGLIHGLAPVAFIKKRLQGYSGVLWSVLFGIPLPLCSCAVIPTGIGLRKSGASEGATVGFVIATPQTGVDSLFVTAALLGWPLALFKVVVAMALGSVAGFVIEYRERARTKLVPQSSPTSGGRSLSLPVIQAPGPPPAPPPAPPSRGWTAVAQYARDSFTQTIEIIRSIYLWILMGVVLSALINVGLPIGVIQSMLGPSGTWLQVPVSLLISLPLYVCATASVSVAAALVHSGLSVGATIVFLIAGPATNLATMGAIFRSFSRGAFVTYMVTVVVGSIVAAYLYDWWIADIFAGSWHDGSETGHKHHSHDSSHWLSQWSAALLSMMFVWFAAESGFAWYRGRRIAAEK